MILTFKYRVKDGVKAIHAKIANARRQHLLEQSATIARQNQLIVVGNVSAAKLTKTKMDFPNVLVLREHSRQSSERYGRAWNKTLDLFRLWFVA